MNLSLYEFYRNYPELQTSIVHFQLRNLVWATTSHDVAVVHNNCVHKWNMMTGATKTVLDLTGTGKKSPLQFMGLVHISTACAKAGLLAAGELATVSY
jgi:hypothetical protein